jgi:acylphosphatase
MTTEELRECLSKQLDEFQMLQSIYSLPGEFRCDNENLIEVIEKYVNGKCESVDETLDFRLKLNFESIKMELSVTFPQFYPLKEHPIFTIRTDSLTRQQETAIKKAIEIFIKSDEICVGETFVYQVVTWLENEINKIIGNQINLENEDCEETKDEEMERIWIWSHHIYSKIKRQNIMKLTRNNDLSGFMWPGKPGVICLEGNSDNVKEVSREIKSWQWQKIKTVKIENFEGQQMRKFPPFEEILTDGDDNGDDVKMNTSRFFKYLDNHDCSEMRKELFGFE